MSRPVAETLKSQLSRYSLRPDAAFPLSRLLDRLARPEAPTSVHDPIVGVDVHIADALAALEIPELRSAGVIADLGSGAGLPGLVLGAVLPDAHVFLVEAVGRKCDFLRSTVTSMGITNVDVVWTRAEAWTDGLGRCDAVCARALAALPVICEYAAPLLIEGGTLVAWKGAVAESEAADALVAANHLGLAPAPPLTVTPFAGSRRLTLHTFRKVAPTPPRFPRRPGIATKRPLSAKALH